MKKIINKNAVVFQCRTQHDMWCNDDKRFFQTTHLGFNAARSMICGATILLSMKDGQLFVSMPHAALWVVQRLWALYVDGHPPVSMPHAALWVVQR